jgi:hypothetical protein
MELDIASFLYTSTYAYYIITYTVDNIKLLLSEKREISTEKKKKESWMAQSTIWIRPFRSLWHGTMYGII